MEQKKITLKLPSREKKADAPPRERRRLDDRYRLQRVKREKKRGSAVLAGALSTMSYVLFVLGASMLIAGFGILVANDMLALVKEEREAVVQVTEPTSVAEVSGQLKEMEIIRYRWAFRLYAKLKHADEPEDGQFSVAAGEYTVRTDMDYGQLITRLTTGVRKTRETVTITVPEGYTLAQIAELLDENDVCTVDEFFEVANTYDFAHFMLKDVPMEENRLEGYLFPDTYEFYKDNKEPGDDSVANAVTAINKMLNNFVKKYNKTMRNLTEEQGKTIADVLKVASLVEKEAKLPDERTTIAGVIYNRLDHPDKYPYLNIDATIIYAVGYKEHLTDADLEVDSPYNTYTHRGLPPTAICNPGLSCMMAALLPEDHSYYYYVADPSDGSHIFSRTLDQHNAAVARVNQ